MTPDEIAREAACALAWVEYHPDGSGKDYLAWLVSQVWQYETEDMANFAVAGLRSRLTAAILAAIERALRSVPVPGGMSEERLAEIVEAASYAFGDRGQLLEDRWNLLADNAHLRRILQDCAADGTLGPWRAGYAAGARAQRRADVAAMHERLEAWRANPHDEAHAGETVIGEVERRPLVGEG